jgi:anti-sigma factor RsiW
MNCAEIRPLLAALLDGELDAVRSAEVSQHLHSCADCTRLYDRQRSASLLLREAADYHATPELLTRRLEKSYAAMPRRRSWAWANAALSAAATVVFALALGLYLRTPSPEDRFAEELVSAHVRSLQPGHLEDVLSTDQHTVKPWFNGRVDFAPPVTDLVTAGFPLLGGRLDYVGGQTVAALVYGYHKHVINVFVCPSKERETEGPESHTLRGYNLVYWSRNGLDFWAVSDAELPALQNFVSLYRREPAPPV